MEKHRFSIALFLSFLIYFGWLSMHERPTVPIDGTGATDISAPAAGGESGVTSELATTEQPQVEAVGEADALWEDWVELGEAGAPGHYMARFSNRGGCIAELRLDGYYVQGKLDDAEKADRDNWVPLLESVETKNGSTGSFEIRTRKSSEALAARPLEDALWQHEFLLNDAGRPDGVRFTLSPGTGATLIKTFRAVPDSYAISFSLEIENNNADLSGATQLTLTPAYCLPVSSNDSFYVEPSAVSVFHSGSELEMDTANREDDGGDIEGTLGGAGKLAFAGVHSKFFAMLLRGQDELAQDSLLSTAYRRIEDQAYREENPAERDKAFRYIATDLELSLEVPAPGQKASRYDYHIYAGPKDRGLITADFPGHERLVTDDLGFFATIARGLLWILSFFHGITGNWGWSIILLTLTVRGLLFPMNRRSQTAMARHQTKMKRVQPKLDEAKAKYAKNSQKQRQEQARIMQEEGVMPPLGGCLPIFLQIPVFFGLFQSLRTSFDMRQSPFISWIQDLSEPDRLMRIDLQLPLVGTIEYLNILPPLMVILWVLQQKVMPKPTDEQALRMQKMMMWMPIMFGFFLYNYAAGLSLYMVTTSVFGILEQTVIKKIWPLDTTEKVRKKGGFMSKMMALSEQAQKMQEQQKKQKLQSAGKGGGKSAKGKRR
ncbi:MAG: YidC/Oxa1 family membrane protein insertase [Planctomycetota bacterium]